MTKGAECGKIVKRSRERGKKPRKRAKGGSEARAERRPEKDEKDLEN